MTTIAYRDGVMAADTRSLRGESILPGHYSKLRRLLDGSIAAGKGDAAIFEPFVGWLNGGKVGPAPPTGEDSAILHLELSGRLVCYERGGWAIEEATDFYAMGSGHTAALAAMYGGADAETAVEIAMKVDPFTGGKVETMKLIPLQIVTKEEAA